MKKQVVYELTFTYDDEVEFDVEGYIGEQIESLTDVEDFDMEYEERPEKFTKLEVSLIAESLTSDRDSIQQKLNDGIYLPEGIDMMKEIIVDLDALIEKSNRIWRLMPVGPVEHIVVEVIGIYMREDYDYVVQAIRSGGELSSINTVEEEIEFLKRNNLDYGLSDTDLRETAEEILRRIADIENKIKEDK